MNPRNLPPVPKPSPRQREALELALRSELTADQVHPRVRNNLTELGWITWIHRPDRPDRGTITDAGRLALNPPPAPREQRPVFLTPARDAHSYTTNRGRADLQAGEVLDPAIVDRFTRRVRAKELEQREVRQRQERVDREALELEDRLRKVMADAALQNVNVRPEMNALERTLQRNPSAQMKAAVERRLKAVERRVYERKAA